MFWIWWSDQFGRGAGYQEDVGLARNAGLYVENIHAPVHEQNNLSLDNLDGESVFQSYLQCVTDCQVYDIPTMVIHLPNDRNPLSQIGISRLELLISKAEQKGVQILLKMYGNRLMAIHLQDNGGIHNQHQLPFDGSIDWAVVMEKIVQAGYQGAITLEPMNWDYEHLDIQQFLELAYERAKRLEDMRKALLDF